jgi:vacuolar-type H+-ATPase subunit D/Vma8
MNTPKKLRRRKKNKLDILIEEVAKLEAEKRSLQNKIDTKKKWILQDMKEKEISSYGLGGYEAQLIQKKPNLITKRNLELVFGPKWVRIHSKMVQNHHQISSSTSTYVRVSPKKQRKRVPIEEARDLATEIREFFTPVNE